MASAPGTIEWLTFEVAAALDPLQYVLDDADALRSFLNSELGFDVPETLTAIGVDGSVVGTVLDAIADLGSALAQDEGSEDTAAKWGALTVSLALALVKVASAPATLRQQLDSTFLDASKIAEELPRRLLNWLVIEHLTVTNSRLLEALKVLGIVEIETIEAHAPTRTSAHVRSELRFDRLLKLLTDPSGWFVDTYGWGRGDDRLDLLLSRLFDLGVTFGHPVSQNPPFAETIVNLAKPAVVEFEAQDTPLELRIPLVSFVQQGIAIEVGLAFLPLPGVVANPRGLGISPFATGTASIGLPLDRRRRWVLTLGGSLNAEAGFGVVFRPAQAPTIIGDPSGAAVAAAGDFFLSLRWSELSGKHAQLVSFGSLASLSAESVELRAGIELLPDGGIELVAQFSINRGKVAIGTGRGDSFVSSKVGASSEVDFDIALMLSSQRGMYLRDGAELEFRRRLNIELGPVTIKCLLVQIRPLQDALTLTVGVSARIFIGPLSATIEDFGLELKLAAPPTGGNLGPLSLEPRFRPPTGIGIAIKAGPVAGGGYLFFNADQGQYAGAIQLSVKALDLAAIGLLSTRLPGGQPGFSLLVIVAAKFPPIQLGFGFTLSGVGGLLGINRTVALEALRDGVRARALDSILFPQDPVANATQLVADLGRVFPIAEGRFTFGPMVKLGWGPNDLLVLEAALVLELPSPVRLALLGRLRIVLPDREAPVVDLRLDVVGIVDFGLGEASMDASLVDSRLAGFALTGDMAVRIGWGATKLFTLSAGGLHPRFERPVGFPALGRMALALANGENPRLRLESYFAVTSNTVQFGARAEISAETDTIIGKLGASAYIGFDALIELDPFHFVVDLGGGIDVTQNGQPLLHAQLAATLTGPNPFQASGFVEVNFLGKHRIPFELGAGEAVAEPVLEVDLGKRLAEELLRPDVWTAVPPRDASGLVCLRDAAPGEDPVLIHPLGGIAIHQRLLPFGKRIARFGAAVPMGGPATFELMALRVGNKSAEPAPLMDDFAPGQYDDLTEDERLSRPAFEAMQAGGSAAATAILLPLPRGAGGSTGVDVEPDYEVAIVDDIKLPSTTPDVAPAPLDGKLIARLANAGAAGRVVGFVGPNDRAIRVIGERSVLADADTLLGIPAAARRGTSTAEAYDRLAARGAPAGDLVVVAVHEAA